MSSLHALFTVRDQQAFQRLLENSRASLSSTSSLSPSGGKSWNKHSASNSHSPSLDVNSRDWLGRTVLHLACSAPDAAATEYVRLLLAHAAIDVNVQDKESHWGSLHIALYNGNLASAMLLLQHSEIDVELKDLEGNTAFDLYNSTVEHTKPSIGPERGDRTYHVPAETTADLFTWGTNRNAVLGSGSGDDRIFPEPVILRQGKSPCTSKFTRIRARQVAMSRLHTVVLTDEGWNNIRVCGFGSGGRLGLNQHTQYDLVPLQHFPRSVIAIALGQDHTLALTDTGEVYSWGLNRFAQLGYVVEQTGDNEPIQLTPKRISGTALRHKIVYGVAACKTASACYTADEVYTWGTNNGQLGYDKSTHPVQVLPKMVFKITHSVIGLAITDSAMACLLESKEVICLWNDRHSRINFQVPAFPSDMTVYHPPQAVKGTHIVKITSCENIFGVLSQTGEVFVFNPTDGDTSTTGNSNRMLIKPQRVWIRRKQTSAVKDFALGSDGSIIVCTESGHVFVRSRNLKSQSSGKSFKFQRIPFIQRVVEVCANSTGAFGALKVDFRPDPIKVVENPFAQDIANITPFMHFDPHLNVGASSSPCLSLEAADLLTDAADLNRSIQGDIDDIVALCNLLYADRQARRDSGSGLFDTANLKHGPDLLVQVQSGLQIPVHRLILSCRCPVLWRILSGATKVVQDRESNVVMSVRQRRSLAGKSTMPILTIDGCQPLSVLLLLTFFYSDRFPTFWDPGVLPVVDQNIRSVTKVGADEIRSELKTLVKMLGLPSLEPILEAPVKRVLTPSMRLDFTRVFDEVQEGHYSLPFKPDIILDLEDKQVFCHSVLLRARSPFFATFFDDDDWTVNRWGVDGTILINLKHLKWRAMHFVTRFLCCGGDLDMFEDLSFVTSVDDLLDLMFDILAAANELLIDRLVLVCSKVILQHININNVCFAFSEATHYTATSLIERLQSYIAVNMETLLESHMLDDLSPALIRQLSCAIRAEQARKSPYVRSTLMADRAMARHGDWLALQDIPYPITRSTNHLVRDSVKSSPPGPGKRGKHIDSLTHNPTVVPVPVAAGEDIFIMDDEIPASLSTHPEPQLFSNSKRSFLWKAAGAAPRADMKAIIAEAESQKNTNSRTPPSSDVFTIVNSKSVQRQSQRIVSDSSCVNIPSGSGSKVSTGHPSTGSIDSVVPSSRQLQSPPSGLSRTRPDPLAANQPPAGTSRTTQTSAKTSRAEGKAVQQPGLGPVFSPSRQSSQNMSTPRRVSGASHAWTAPIAKPIVNASPGTLTSFAAIQLMQEEEGVSSSSAKQSLKEIQEEEQAQKAEQEFLKWWAAEAERVRLESDAAVKAVAAAGKGSLKKPKHMGQRKPGSGAPQQRATTTSGRSKKVQSVVG